MSSLIDTNAFDYVNVLDKAMDASALRHEAISNNISNADTPNYKRQDVDFETQLAKALRHSRYKSMDAKEDETSGSDSLQGLFGLFLPHRRE